MNKNKIAPISEFAGYNITRQSFPEKIRQIPKSRVSYIHELFISSIPEIKTIEEVVLFPLGRGWDYKSADNGVQVFVYGSFRSEYKIIMNLAEITAEFYAETLYSQTIIPIKRCIWRDYLYRDKKFVGALHRKGITSFSREYYE